MRIIRNIIYCLLVGILYWFCGVVINYIDNRLYRPSILIVLPFLVGIVISLILYKESKYKLILYCIIVIFVKYFITFMRAMLLFYNDASYSYVLDSVKSFLILGPFQIGFAILGIYSATILKSKKDRIRS